MGLYQGCVVLPFEKADIQDGLVAKVVKSKGTSRHMIIKLANIHVRVLHLYKGRRERMNGNESMGIGN